jgi:hypothetical protein
LIPGWRSFEFLVRPFLTRELCAVASHAKFDISVAFDKIMVIVEDIKNENP